MVATHKKFPMPSDSDLYMPILVGAVKNYNKGIKYQRDDEGENISIKNPNYNELTAMYWGWKNLNVDAIGLVHYRRLFSLHRKRSLDGVLDKNEIENLLKRAPIILPKKRNYYIETNYSHYIHAHHEAPLELMQQVIKEQYPSYFQSFKKVMNSKKAHMFNMMIMKKDFFDTYAEWVFNVLSEVEERIDITGYSVQEARVFGYLSELLMDVWLSKNQYNYVEINWVQLGGRNLVKKTFSFLMRKYLKSQTVRTHF